MGRIRTAAPALAALAAALIAGCGGGGSGSTVTRSAAASGTSGAGGSDSATAGHAATATRTVTRTVTRPPARPSTSNTGGGSANTVNTSAQMANCRAAGVKLRYLGGQGAAGHGLLGFAMRNTGDAPCTTIGYPGILFLARDGSALPTHLTRTTHDFFGPAKYSRLTVAPGASTSFRLGVSHGLRSSKHCVTAASVQVIVPNDTTPVRVRIPGGVFECGGVVTVTPMQPGTSAFGYH